MVHTIAGETALTPVALNAIVAKAEGLPLFLEEVTRDYLESGRADAIPSTIQASLLARLDRLGPAKEVAQAGAAIGREFDRQLLARVLPLDELELADALDRLTTSELVFRRGTPPSETFSFKHALVQDTAYESLLKNRRRSLHAAIAEAIRVLYPAFEVAQPELLAHHYTRAALAEPATAYWEKAGNRAPSAPPMSRRWSIFGLGWPCWTGCRKRHAPGRS
jgi:predicted ATPase